MKTLNYPAEKEPKDIIKLKLLHEQLKNFIDYGEIKSIR